MARKKGKARRVAKEAWRRTKRAASVLWKGNPPKRGKANPARVAKLTRI